MKRLSTFLIYLVCIGYLHAQELSPDQLSAIDSIFAKLENPEDPGFAVGVVLEGKIVYEKYSGLASLQHQVAIDENSKFNIASCAKQFTALCVLDLAVAGKLDLDEDFRTYTPDIMKDVADAIPLKTLFNHSSGIRDYCDLMSIQGDPWWRREGLDNDDAIELLNDQKSLNFTPGSDYEYSNSNYTILTAVVEAVSGQPFHEYAKNLFERFGMESTHFLTNYMSVIPNHALPYTNWGDGVWKQYPMMTDLNGDGFLFTTLKDQLTFEQLLQNSEQSDSLKELLEQSQQPIPGAKIDTYGYGVEFGTFRGQPYVHHAGGTGSYNAQFLRFPEERLSIVVISNNGNFWSGGTARDIARTFVKKLGESVYDPPIPESFAKSSLKSDLAGSYLNPEGDLIKIIEEGDGLYWKNGNNNPFKLISQGGDHYQFEVNSKLVVVFSEDDDEQLFTVYYPGSSPRKHPKIIAFSPDEDYLKSIEGIYYNAETDVQFEITHKEGKVFNFSNENFNGDLELIMKDHLLFNNFYKMVVSHDPGCQSKTILVSYARIRDLKFVRQ